MEILAALKKFETNLGPKQGWRELVVSQLKGEVRFNEPMKHHTSIRIGGPADLLIVPQDLAELQLCLRLAAQYQVSYCLIGWGSNVLVRDAGIRGMVIKLQKALNQFCEMERTEEYVLVEAGAGYPLAKFVDYAQKQKLQGLEYLYGIPASMGGALRMNAGTKKGEIATITKQVKILLPNGEVETLQGTQLKFSYRHLKIPQGAVIIGGVFKLIPDTNNAAQAHLEEYRQYRHATQPLDFPNCGSVFKNPEGNHAARLIEEAGLKDVRVGGARISNKHANFIINEGTAQAVDVIALITLMKDKVREIFDVKLELEVKIIGE